MTNTTNTDRVRLSGVPDDNARKLADRSIRLAHESYYRYQRKQAGERVISTPVEWDAADTPLGFARLEMKTMPHRYDSLTVEAAERLFRCAGYTLEQARAQLLPWDRRGIAV